MFCNTRVSLTCIQFQRPFENLRDNSIIPNTENGSSRQTAIEHGRAFNCRLKYIGETVEL